MEWDTEGVSVTSRSVVYRKEEKLSQLQDSNHLFCHRGKLNENFIGERKGLPCNVIKFSIMSDRIIIQIHALTFWSLKLREKTL